MADLEWNEPDVDRRRRSALPTHGDDPYAWGWDEPVRRWIEEHPELSRLWNGDVLALPLSLAISYLPEDWAGTDAHDGEWESGLRYARVTVGEYEVPLYAPTEHELERQAWERYRRERGLRRRRRLTGWPMP